MVVEDIDGLSGWDWAVRMDGRLVYVMYDEAGRDRTSTNGRISTTSWNLIL